MSLSRILNNDDPEPPNRHIRHIQRPPLPSDPSLMSPLSPSGHMSPHSHGPSNGDHYQDYPQSLPRAPSYPSSSHRSSHAWDQHPNDYAPGNMYPPGPTRDEYYSPHMRQRFVSPPPSRDRDRERDYPPPPPFQPESEDEVGKKRRRDATEDSDYQPPGRKKYATRGRTAKGKQMRAASPVETHPSALHVNSQAASDRLASSDLEDCEDIWVPGLQDYRADTQRRQRSVARWFESHIAERNAANTFNLSEDYRSRISRIPVRPPSPPSPPPTSRLHDPQARPLSPAYANGHSDGHYTDRNMQRYAQDAEDVAGFLEDAASAPVIDTRKGKRKPKEKRAAAASRANPMPDIDGHSESMPPLPKRRKVDKAAAEFLDEPEFPVPIDAAFPAARAASAVKGKEKFMASAREGSMDSVSVAMTPKGRKKAATKKKPGLSGLEHLALPSGSVSASGDVTPALSRPESPAPASTAIVYDLDEVIPPLKKAKKIDDSAMVKRVKTLEEAQRKVWTNIARRDVAKVYKFYVTGCQARLAQSERLARLASIQARKPFTKTPKAAKDLQVKAKRLMREMQVFWKKNEREERDVRKREQKEAIDRAKVEEEKREAARQARKLEFLISQTELYSHFVGNKLKTSELEGDTGEKAAPAGADLADVDPSTLGEIDFNEEDKTNLYLHARHNAEEAISLAKERAQAFDTQAALERKTNEAIKLAKAQAHIRDDAEEITEGPTTKAPLVDLDSNELNFMNPDSLSGPLTIGQPTMLMAQLKEYQLKGLNWLATLYEQGINGILADEMGLGKTVQSISLLAYLAETHDIWGPFLVVAPASTLHNWQQELTRFVPKLKALPYWGNVKDRATLRKFWSKKEISYDQDAPFHVLITSYQLVTQDQQYFQRVKWQYMILDEAQNIKNSASVRWKTLLGFHCRNRLLLTGTPIQNSMQELWALLHFIMPSLFDSHDEFNEWFSKDIENAAENKGSKLNEHQLRRLHMILKPFMLRRVKRHVQNELSEKIEKDIYVDLSARQRALYKALLANVSVADLLAKAANIGDVDSARSLMNLVMQFRKVCNHPELFERADVVAPYSFCKFGRPGPLSREGDFVEMPYSTRNPIEFTIPELLYTDGGLLGVPSEDSTSPQHSSFLSKLMNIWSTDWIHKSLYEDDSDSFSFLRFTNLSPQETHSLHISPLTRRALLAVQEENDHWENSPYYTDPELTAHIEAGPYHLERAPSMKCFEVAEGLPSLAAISSFAWSESCLSRPGMKWLIPAVVAPPMAMYCTDRSFLEAETRYRDAPLESAAFFGIPPYLRDSDACCEGYARLMPGLPADGLFGESSQDQLPSSYMQVPEAKRLIYDSAKLARLDSLLQELKAGDHRVLVYFQMTRMMDLMEEYLIYRQYKYLRLDGSSKLEDRRDMVIDWQTRPDIFVFLLSTRAGGLGINLTAADTVVFYDHDWNPSNDAQAMDRAHRLGQTRQVTVYRLITKGTIDERIVQLASVKKDVQDIVVGNKNFQDVAKPSEIVQLLLNDEQLANLDTSAPGLSSQTSGPSTDGAPGTSNGPIRDLWNEEGDDFFGHSGTAPATTAAIEGLDDENNSTPTPTSGRGKKRRGGAPSTRGRKPGPKKKNVAAEEA
ncbi:hypothetical protein HGRIS_007769 [Hohenbuehelia grisea]|uniref:Chromatin-remodeling ATPase INO80 n=1 Tax=Hohenbuehelia grisea TaxID=104357 RepID=A0ABR3J5X0_9AGAR